MDFVKQLDELERHIWQFRQTGKQYMQKQVLDEVLALSLLIDVPPDCPPYFGERDSTYPPHRIVAMVAAMMSNPARMVELEMSPHCAGFIQQYKKIILA